MTNEHATDKLRREVEVVLDGGVSFRGSVFLSKHASHHGPERVMDLLCQPSAFFPLTEAGGETRFLSRRAVVKIVLDAASELPAQGGAVETAGITVTMSDGSKESGALAIDAREGFTRPLDELNRGDRFIVLRDGERAKILGTRHILCVQVPGVFFGCS